MTSGLTENNGRLEQRLDGCRAYFEHVLTPNAELFFGQSRTPASTINLVTSLFHFHEWLHREFKEKLLLKYGAEAKTPGDFWRCVQKTNPDFGYIRDMTNGSKHVELEAKGKGGPSTEMRGIGEFAMEKRGFGRGAFGRRGFGGGPDPIVTVGDRTAELYPISKQLLAYWSDLLLELEGQSGE